MSEVVKLEPQNDSRAMVTLIERIATDPNADVAKLERLFELKRQFDAAEAEASYNQAMAAAQAEMGRISTDATNPQTRSKYASYAQLDRHLRPVYTRHGFALSFDTAESPLPEHLRVVCHVSHRGGHSRDHHCDMPADGKGAKGGDVMTKTHATGAAMSYGMRYLLKLIFNVAIGEDDTDGNMPDDTITAAQAATLKRLLQETGSDVTAFLKWMKSETVDSLPAKKYDVALKRLEAKKAGK